MDGLAVYESSSDAEDDGSVANAEQRAGTTTELPVNGASLPHTDNLNTDNHEGAVLLGPTMPQDVVTSYEQQAERDILRQLTRATHPMSSIPDSPSGSPGPAASARIQRYLELKARGVHFNEDLASKSSFRNPSLLSNMLKRAGIEGDEQYASSLPTTLWDPFIFPQWSYRDGLLKIQQEQREKSEAVKKAQSAAGKRSIEFASASNSGGSSRNSTPTQLAKRRRP